MTESNIEESREYTKAVLLRMSKPEIIAVADEIGVDLSVLPKLTKDSISDAIMVFLEPYLEEETSDDASVDEHGPFDEPPVEVPASETIVAGEDEKPIDVEESVEEEAPEEPSGPAPTVMTGSHQEILRPTKVEQSVRVRRIAESNK